MSFKLFITSASKRGIARANRNTCRKLFLLTGLVMVCLSATNGLFPLFASAATAPISGGGNDVGVWVDHSDIMLNGVNYHDNVIDNTLNFVAVGQSGCAAKDNINIPLGSTDGSGKEGAGDPSNAYHTGTFQTWDIGNGNDSASCVADPTLAPITFTNQKAYNDYFIWVDAGTIETSDSSQTTFILATDNSDPGYKAASGNVYNASCKSQINANAASPATGSLVLWDTQSDSDGNNGNGPYQNGWPFPVRHVKLGNSDGNCAYSSPIALGQGQVSSDPKAKNRDDPNIADPLVNGKLASSLPAGTGAGGAGGGDGSTTTTAPSIDCHVSVFNPLSWFLCPLASGLETVAAGLDNAIQSKLDFHTSTLTGNGSGGTSDYETSFNDIRNISLGLIGLGALVAIVSEAAGFEIFDAYTIRKIMPRLIACTIGISLAWPILIFIINLSDGLGQGVRSIVYLAANHNGGSGTVILGGGGAAISNIFAGAAIGSLGFVGLLSFAATGALAAAVALLVLILRQMVIIALVIFAPFAIASYLLPNTQKMWKLWVDSFIKGLLMFPLIMGFIALGRVFSTTASDNLLSFVAYFAPYFLLPFTFRLAGGAISNIGGFVNDRGKGSFDRLSKFRAEQPGKRLAKARAGELYKGRLPGTRRLSGATNTALARGTTPYLGFGKQGQAAYQQRMVNMAAERAKSASGQAVEHNDNVLRAQTYSNEAVARANMGRDFGMNDADVSTAIAGAKANGGFGAARQVFAAKQLAATGTGYDNLDQVAQTIARVGGSNASVISGLAGDINSTTKTVGRGDLAPGFAGLRDLALGEAGIGGGATAQNYADASLAAARGFDAVTTLRGKPQDVTNKAAALTTELNTHWAQYTATGDAASLQRSMVAAAQIRQLDDSKTYASPQNQAIVNDLLANTGAARRFLGQLVAPSGEDPRDGRAIPANQLQQDWQNLVSPPRNPNDPNLP